MFPIDREQTWSRSNCLSGSTSTTRSRWSATTQTPPADATAPVLESPTSRLGRSYKEVAATCLMVQYNLDLLLFHVQRLQFENRGVLQDSFEMGDLDGCGCTPEGEAELQERGSSQTKQQWASPLLGRP